MKTLRMANLTLCVASVTGTCTAEVAYASDTRPIVFGYAASLLFMFACTWRLIERSLGAWRPRLGGLWKVVGALLVVMLAGIGLILASDFGHGRANAYPLLYVPQCVASVFVVAFPASDRTGPVQRRAWWSLIASFCLWGAFVAFTHH